MWIQFGVVNGLPGPGPSTPRAYPPGDKMVENLSRRAQTAMLELHSVVNGQSWVPAEPERGLMGAALREVFRAGGWGRPRRAVQSIVGGQ